MIYLSKINLKSWKSLITTFPINADQLALPLLKAKFPFVAFISNSGPEAAAREVAETISYILKYFSHIITSCMESDVTLYSLPGCLKAKSR